MPIKPTDLPELDLSSIDAELRAEQEYGNSPLEAFAGETAASATLGLSDAVLVDAGVDPERLREVRERSPVAAGLGTAAGIVAPAIATMGTSTAAQAAALPARALGTVGTIAEKATAAAAKKYLPATGAKLASTVAKNAAEGALVGAGELVSDVALENKDLSAESAMATIGTGALFGGGFGVALGTASAAAPKVTSAFKGLKQGVKNIKQQAVDPLLDPVEASLETVTGTAAHRQKVREVLGKRVDELPDYLKTDLEIGYTSTSGALARKNREVLKETGIRIGEVSQSLDDLARLNGSPVGREEVYGALVTRLDDIEGKLGPAKHASNAERKLIQRYRRDLVNLAKSEDDFSFRELDALRKQYAGKKFKGGGALESFEANMANSLRGEIREISDAIAAKVEPTLGGELKQLNRKYHLGSTIDKPLRAAAERAPDLSTPFALAATTVGRMGRNTVVINDLASKAAQVQAAIAKGVDASMVPRPSKRTTDMASNAVLVQSGLAFDQKKQKAPKTKLEAFKNVQANLTDLINDEEKAVEMLARKTARVANADPETGMVLQQRLTNAIQFLNSKMPKSAVLPGAFVRPYQPSSLELAKFERYLQIAETPLTVLDEVKHGTLTREHVEALQALYPEIYKQIQQRVMTNINSGQWNLSYERKLQLGILLGVPADSSLQPESVLQLQATFAPQEEGPQPRAKGLDQMDMSGRAETGVQAIQND